MKISLYIHIPFCQRKCLYCDFLSFYAPEQIREKYVDVLVNEINIKSAQCFEYEVCSIFFGGGTPSLLSGEDIYRITNAIYNQFDISDNCEISMEMNPGTFDFKKDGDEKLKMYKSAGINRVSIGLQSAIDSELEGLGRIHRKKDFELLYEHLLLNGYKNINIDLMSGIHNQTIETYLETLNYVISLPYKVPHISAYSLIVEEGTPYYGMELNLPSEEDERKMYEMTDTVLSQAGYHRYEISNYALDGYECAHNKVYWQRGNYLGLGLNSSSMIENIRWQNTDSMEDYLGGDMKRYNEKLLSKNEQMEEFMYLGLRMMCGVNRKNFREYFGQDFPMHFEKAIAKYTKMGLLYCNDDDVMLTREGINVSNVIMSDFLFT